MNRRQFFKGIGAVAVTIAAEPVPIELLPSAAFPYLAYNEVLVLVDQQIRRLILGNALRLEQDGELVLDQPSGIFEI